MFRQWVVMRLALPGMLVLLGGCTYPQVASDARAGGAALAGEVSSAPQPGDQAGEEAGEEAGAPANATTDEAVADKSGAGTDKETDKETAAPKPGVVNQLVRVAVHEPFQIELRSNPSTGFRWEVESGPEALQLVSEGGRAGENCKEGMVGCGGYTIFNYEAQQAGEWFLVLRYVRPWIKDTTGARRHTVLVVVE